MVPLHASASRWLAGNGLLADAIRHAIAGGEHELTADLVELTVADVRRRRQSRAFRAWLAALPDVVRRRPLLATCAGDCRLSEGDFDGVEAWLDAAEAGLNTSPSLTIATGGSLAEAARGREGEVRSLPAMVAVYRASVAAVTTSRLHDYGSRLMINATASKIAVLHWNGPFGPARWR